MAHDTTEVVCPNLLAALNGGGGRIWPELPPLAATVQCIYARDITERKQAEEPLRQAKQWLKEQYEHLRGVG